MSVLDLERLLAPVAEGNPGGADLEDDPKFVELFILAKGKPERQMGDAVVPAEPPDWRAVKQASLVLLERTRDLRIGELLARALLRTDGLAGFTDGLALLRGWITDLWNEVHPRLDPDDPDPIRRTNTHANLASYDATLVAVRDALIVAAPRAGHYSFRDALVATGKLPPPAGFEGEPPSTGILDAAFREVAVEEIRATTETLDRALAETAGICNAMVEKVGDKKKAVCLDELTTMLRAARQYVAHQLTRRVEEGAGAAAAVDGGVGGRLPGAIRTRDDVVRTLDRLIEYFRRNEPASPVPLLLQRAKRLTGKSFLDIIRDIAPDSLTQVEAIRGPEEGG